MREEMWTQFAPATEMPEQARSPVKGVHLTEEDYA